MHAHYPDIHTNSSEGEKEMISVAKEVAPTPIYTNVLIHRLCNKKLCRFICLFTYILLPL